METDQLEMRFEDPAPEPDLVKNPAHYTRWKIQPKNFIVRNDMEFWRGNIIKYVARAGFKIYEGKDAVQSEIIDLEKGIDYLRMRINLLNGEVEL